MRKAKSDGWILQLFLLAKCDRETNGGLLRRDAPLGALTYHRNRGADLSTWPALSQLPRARFLICFASFSISSAFWTSGNERTVAESVLLTCSLSAEASAKSFCVSSLISS